MCQIEFTSPPITGCHMSSQTMTSHEAPCLKSDQLSQATSPPHKKSTLSSLIEMALLGPTQLAGQVAPVIISDVGFIWYIDIYHYWKRQIWMEGLNFNENVTTWIDMYLFLLHEFICYRYNEPMTPFFFLRWVSTYPAWKNNL